MPAEFGAKITNRPKGHASCDCRDLSTFAHMNMEDDLQVRWWTLEEKMMQRFGKKPDLESVLFRIGLQELGTGQEK